MNKIQRNAKAYAKLLDVEYIFYLGYKGKGKKVILCFNEKNFHHLEGIGQLNDIALHNEPGTKIFEMALNGKISEEDLRKSEKFEESYTENKLKYFYTRI